MGQAGRGDWSVQCGGRWSGMVALGVVAFLHM